MKVFCLLFNIFIYLRSYRSYSIMKLEIFLEVMVFFLFLEVLSLELCVCKDFSGKRVFNFLR